uniref:Uncharacterized protein n=1 Tax=Corethron hystrix TaxID=216773 RepID=A0A7S1FV37_9STRA
MNGDTFNDFDILAPQDSHYRIFSQIGLGGCPGAPNCTQGSLPLEVTGTLNINLDAKGLFITVNQRTLLGALRLALGMGVWYDLAILAKLSALQILDRPVCLLTPLARAHAYGTSASVASHWSETLVRIEGTSEVENYNFTDRWEGDYNELLADAAHKLQKILNQYLEKVMQDAPYLCRGEEPPKMHLEDEPVSNFLKWAFSVIVITAGSLAILLCQQKSINDGRLFNDNSDNRIMNTYPSYLRVLPNCDMDTHVKTISISDQRKDTIPHEHSVLTEPLLHQVSSTKDLDNTSSPLQKNTSLIFHPTVSLFSGILLCTTILGAVMLFIVSNTAIGGSVQARIEGGFPGADTFMHTLTFDNFSLITTVRDMWNAGMYPLSILILLLSGVWPYVKLLLIFYTCLAPLEICSKERRESILIWLDILGKYSLLDAYILGKYEYVKVR